jgi:hypothetical protein
VARLVFQLLLLLPILLAATSLAFGGCLVVVAFREHPPVLKSGHRAYLASAFLPMFVTIIVPSAMTLLFNWDIRKNNVLAKVGGGLGIVLAATGIALALQAQIQGQRRRLVLFSAAVLVSVAPLICWLLIVAMWQFVPFIK